MTEEWIVRVEGKEYGPVDTDALREWRREGRLIPENELRRVDTESWIPAGQLPEVFADAVLAAPPPLPQDFETAKTWRQIIADTFRIYRSAFPQLMLFGLLTAVPMFVLRWTLPTISMPDLMSGDQNPASMSPPPPICLAMFVVVLLVWPVSTAGFQLVADNVLRGQSRSLGTQFFAAMRCWGRVLSAAALVYGSYFFWVFVPLAAMLAPIRSGNLFLVVIVTLLTGAVMVYMNARLFINFLFWQPTVVLEENPPLLALRESKELARSSPEAPPLDRPLYRGAIIASLWLLLLLALTFGVQLAFVTVRLAGISDPEQAMELVRKLAQAQTPDALMIAANVTVAAIYLLLQPLLAAAFVVLYHDARARLGKSGEEINRE